MDTTQGVLPTAEWLETNVHQAIEVGLSRHETRLLLNESVSAPSGEAELLILAMVLRDLPEKARLAAEDGQRFVRVWDIPTRDWKDQKVPNLYEGNALQLLRGISSMIYLMCSNANLNPSLEITDLGPRRWHIRIDF